MSRSLLFLMVTASIASSQGLVQTDWSSGPGVTGPDWEWRDAFWECQDIDWFSVPGQLSILPSWEDEVCSGTLVSSLAWIPMGTDWEIEWGEILWLADEPEGSDLYFRLRTGDDPSSMSAWSEPIYESGTYLGDLLPDSILLIQYMAILQSDSFDPDSWPVLYEVTVEGWYPGGIGEPGSASAGSILETLGNPGSGSVRLAVTGPLPAESELAVFDLGGRRISTLFCGEIPEGPNEFEFIAPPGVYVARLVAGWLVERTLLTLIH